MKRLSLIALAFILAACVPPMAPIVTEFNGDSVNVQASAAANTPEVTAEANRICRTVGKRAEYASSRQLPSTNQYDFSITYSHLFLCLG